MGFVSFSLIHKPYIWILISDQVNMIYLGLESDRVPVIPPFGPNPHTSNLSFMKSLHSSSD